ncbi:unnamed protein product [Amoebophrya sp. A25]|nr:unnamed protein product [Amoebophrya sp. A25]|eukprot:GSA25T00008372001.1
MFSFFGNAGDSSSSNSGDKDRCRRGSSSSSGRSASSSKEQAREWNRKLKSEMRSLEREVMKLQREEAKAAREVKNYAQKNEIEAARTLAKEVVRGRKTIQRLHIAKANLNSVSLQLTTLLGSMKVADAMRESTEIMQSMNIAVGSISSMRQMASEMQRAGLIRELVEENIEEAMEVVGGVEEGDEAALVDAVLKEVAADTMAQAKTVPSTSLPSAAAASRIQEHSASEAVNNGSTSAVEAKAVLDAEEDLLEARLNAL